jgi:putative Holliday junction resolvase
MRLLGIDYGSRRVGIALGNPEGTFARPYEVLPNNKELVPKILAIIKKEDVGGIVIGESKNFKGADNEIMKMILPFVEHLKKETNLPVYLELEFLTSHQAQYFQGHHDMLDASAAAIILQSYLDRKS